MKNKIKILVALFVFLGSACGILFYFMQENQAERDFSTIKEEKEEEFDLLSLYDKNPDMVGWIKIPGTNIDYPVMRGDKYLFRDFKKKFSNSGTPFVANKWDYRDVNTLVYGHNMWVQKTMFNALHKYESEKFWTKHKNGVFYAICETDSGEVYVEQRDFEVSYAIKTSVKSKFKWKDCIYQREEESLFDYAEWCEKQEMYDTHKTILSGYGAITLCTCSYHILGHRHDGRFLVMGTITKKDIVQVR